MIIYLPTRAHDKIRNELVPRSYVTPHPSPRGGHRARYLDSLASAAVGVLAARACGPCPTRPVGGTRGLCRSNSPATHAPRVFSPKKNSNIIATNRNNTSVVISSYGPYNTQIIVFLNIYYATSYYRYYVKFKNFESKRVLSHPHHCPASSFLVSYFFKLFFASPAVLFFAFFTSQNRLTPI